MSIRFTVGMAVYDDFFGAWSTIQALRLYFKSRVAEIVVIDNNPDSEQGETTRKFCEASHTRYVPFPHPKGPALAKGEVFKQSRTEHTVCLDSHVLLVPGSLDAFAAFYEANPGSEDLLHGPLIHDNLVSLSTHFDDVWPVDEVEEEDPVTKKKIKRQKPSQMWGRWGRDLKAFPLMQWELPPDQQEFEERIDPVTFKLSRTPKHYPEVPKPTAPWFEIPAQGMGLFACRTKSFLGFNDKFVGFGGEEWYIHEKFRRAGRKVFCVSGALWSHRFARPGGAKYPVQIWHKYRNYEIGHAELGIDPKRLRDHFIGHGLVPAEWTAAALRGDLEPPAAQPEPAQKGCVTCNQSNKDEPLAEGDLLEAEYARVCAEPSDINEHLPTIRGLVETVGPTCRVVELGTRNAVTTTALLAGRPARLVTYDAVTTHKAKRLGKYAAKELPGTAYEIRVMESTKGQGEPSDVLVVDTDPHTADHVFEELNLHGSLCTRFIVFHDTQIYGEVYGDKPGVLPAIRRWLHDHREWTLIRRDTNNNGLCVISRDDRDKQHPPGVLRKALNFTRAVARHAADGGIATSPAECDRRVELCLVCPKRYGDVCGECGCPVMKKASWRSEVCPVGKWAVGEDVAPEAAEKK